MFSNMATRALAVALAGIAAVFCLVVLFWGPPDGPDEGVTVVVEEVQTMPDAIGVLSVVLKNLSKKDLVIESFYQPWNGHSGGDVTLTRTDGSVVYKQSMVLDAVVQQPIVMKRGQALSNRVSLLDYYLNLPEELAKGDLTVSWTYRPRFTNGVITNIASGMLILKSRK